MDKANATIKPWYSRSLIVYCRNFLVKSLHYVGQALIILCQILHDVQQITSMEVCVKG